MLSGTLHTVTDMSHKCHVWNFEIIFQLLPSLLWEIVLSRIRKMA